MSVCHELRRTVLYKANYTVKYQIVVHETVMVDLLKSLIFYFFGKNEVYLHYLYQISAWRHKPTEKYTYIWRYPQAKQLANKSAKLQCENKSGSVQLNNLGNLR